MDKKRLQDGIAEYESHLTSVASTFNAFAKDVGLPVDLSAESALAALSAGVGLVDAASFATRADDTGIVHESQLRTALACIVELRKDEKRCGHVVGAMQSGKTTTSLALQWAGPILYLLTGRKAYPFYIIGNQRNHEDQTTIELNQFLNYYGGLQLRLNEGESPAEDALFLTSPSLKTYREHVLRDTRKYLVVPKLEDIVHRRVGGEQSVGRIVSSCRESTEQGFRPLMIIDEPQFGASDRVVEGDQGPERRRCMLATIFDRIEEALGATRDDHWFVGLSATPFEMNDVQRFWEVRQSLTSNYSGFNFFNGVPICKDVDVSPPETLSLADYGRITGVQFLGSVSLSAYDKPRGFRAHARRIGFAGTHEEFRRQSERALQATIYEAIKRYQAEGDLAVGLCIRAFNNNMKTRELIERLSLDPARIEVLDYFGNETSGLSVKRVIASRKHPHLPYLVLVTNRARMADAFPPEVRFFMDLAQKATDLNALLQGLLGRACGYNKRSTVVLSEQNARIVDSYVATNGGYVHKTSRHTVAVGGWRRGAPTSMLRLRTEMDDPVVKDFFRRLNEELVDKIGGHSAKIRIPRAKSQSVRRGPILRIAQELSLFEHIESPTVRASLFPSMPAGFQVMRSNDKRREPTGEIGYSLDDAGNCRYTFRHLDRSAAAKGGGAGRAKGRKDKEAHLEPTLYIEKYDRKTGEAIGSKELPGSWRAFMVTFPLTTPVQELRAAEVAYPVATSPYDHYMADDERARRDGSSNRPS